MCPVSPPQSLLGYTRAGYWPLMLVVPPPLSEQARHVVALLKQDVCQVSFLELLKTAFDDFTIKVLCASGALSIGLDQVCLSGPKPCTP